MKVVEDLLDSREGLKEVNPSEACLFFQSKVPTPGVSSTVKHSY